MLHDLRQAARVLAKHPGFVLLSACVLALGIGLNTAIFSIVRSMLWTPLPVPASHELVSIYQVYARQPDRPTVPHRLQYEYLKEHNQVFAGLTAHWAIPYYVRADDETHTLNGAWVLSNYFDVLGVKPVIGRPLTGAEDDVAYPQRAAVISHALWVRLFRSDPAVVGRTIEMMLWGSAYVPYTIVGIMPPEFSGVSEPWKPVHVWVTFAQGHDVPKLEWGGGLIGRLRRGVPLEQARAVVAAQGRQHYYSRPNARPEYESRLVAYPTNSVKMPFDPSAALIPTRLAAAMTLVVAMVLLVAAANIAGILAARGVGRAGEIAIRRALGASRARIVRQLLVESLLLAAAGGVLGLGLSRGLIHLFRVFTPVQFALEVRTDAVVLAFAFAICIVAGIVVGVLPARQAGRLEVLPWLTAAGAFQTGGRRSWARHAVTIPQAVLSLVLLLTAGVYVRSLLAIELADLGYQPRNLLVASVSLMTAPAERVGPRMALEQRQALEARYAARARTFYAALMDRLAAVQGAADVAVTTSLPMHEPPERPDWSVLTEDAVLAGQRDGQPAERAAVSPRYFATLGMTLIAGRDFDARDTSSTPKVAVISSNLARSLWPGGDGRGRTLALASTWNAKEKPELYSVVGIVSEVSPILHERPSRPFIYLPLSQQWRPSGQIIVVRGAGDSRALIPAIKDAVLRADAFSEVYRVRTMGQMLTELMYPRRIAGAVLATSGLVALFLATLGVYGVVSYAAAQRTGEIGVRMALGADRRDIRRLVLRDGVAIAAWGSAGGLALGYAAIRLASSRYLALPQLDPLTLLVTPLVFSAVILLACYLPARRAGRVNPFEVLRKQ